MFFLCGRENVKAHQDKSGSVSDIMDVARQKKKKKVVCVRAGVMLNKKPDANLIT